MRIVVIGPVYPYRGGIAQYTGFMSQNLSRKHEVINLSFKMQYPGFLYHNEQKSYDNDTFQAPDTREIIHTANPANWIFVSRYIAKLNPDLVIVQWWHPYFAPSYWSILKSVKKKARIIFVCHNVLPHENFPLKKRLTKMVLKQGQGFIVHSNQDAEDLQSLIHRPAYRETVLPTYAAFKMSGMNKEMAREKLGIAPQTEVILFFGFIREYKGLKHLIRALPSIVERRPNVHLMIVGEFFSGGKQEYLDLIQQTNTSSYLTLVDHYVPDKEVEPYFAACDLVVLPYESATQSAIVQVAYGFEKPVVATTVGGLPEVVKDGQTGFLVPPKAESDLADAVVRFFEQNLAESFRQGIHKEAQRYSWDRMTETIEGLYDEIRK